MLLVMRVLSIVPLSFKVRLVRRTPSIDETLADGWLVRFFFFPCCVLPHTHTFFLSFFLLFPQLSRIRSSALVMHQRPRHLRIRSPAPTHNTLFA